MRYQKGFVKRVRQRAEKRVKKTQLQDSADSVNTTAPEAYDPAKDPLLKLDHDSGFEQDSWNREAQAQAIEQLKVQDAPSAEMLRATEEIQKLKFAAAKAGAEEEARMKARSESKPARIVWYGHTYQLAELIKNMHDLGFLGSISLDAAYDLARKHFEDKHGKEYTVGGLREGYCQKHPESRDKVRA